MIARPVSAVIRIAFFVLASYFILFREVIPPEGLAFDADVSLTAGSRVDGLVSVPIAGEFKLFLAFEETSPSEAERAAALIRAGWRDHEGPPGMVIRFSLEADGRPVQYETPPGYGTGYLLQSEARILLGKFRLDGSREYTLRAEVVESEAGLGTLKSRLIVRPDPFAASDVWMRNAMRPWIGVALAVCVLLSMMLRMLHRGKATLSEQLPRSMPSDHGE